MEALAEKIVEVHLTLVRNISERFRARIHGFHMTDDWGTQQAAFISQDLWVDFFQPFYRRLFNAMHAAGYDVWVHSCGKINEIIEGRLLGRTYRRKPTDATIGGIPVDSEYVIFIIDTSGSMHNYAWSMVQKKMEEILDIYPKVKGIQVMNDMGQHMFRNYAGKWIPDTPGRRRIILDRLRRWTPFSNSSPVEGITHAIRTYSTRDRKISLYVLGDEFTGKSIDDVVETVDRINREDREGNRLVRIHGIGFPTKFSHA